MSEPEQSYRLPRAARPDRYELELDPDLETATFGGSAVVTVQVLEPLEELVLNAKDLEITEASLDDREGTVALDGAAERAVLRFGDSLRPGTYELRLVFRGTLNDLLQGFYRSTYVDQAGDKRTLAATQFESVYARRAFPCWDEPDFKARFKVTLIVDEKLTALSNGEVEQERPLGDGRKAVSFAETIPMSTYLVAFVVGPFELTEPVHVEGVPLRVAAVTGKLRLTGFAVEAGSHALAFLSRYFGIPYPAGKLDHVAIPDFAAGAMENLGLVTYRETALLVDPSTASQLELQRVAQVVAHETAHMWFGDLVTMRWWNGTWLNEAFATFMELTATEAFRPEWEVWTWFGAGRAAALATDSLEATRPVEYPVGPPEEVEGMFDVLTYQKGGSVLRMLEQYLGAETFRAGISHYLELHRYGNTETTDLWDAIEETSGEPVRQIMDSWIFQGGHPELLVSPVEGGVRLSQRRFRYRGEDRGERWAVPVSLRASVGGHVVHQRLLLDVDQVVVQISPAGPEPPASSPVPAAAEAPSLDWVVVNEGASGFYRVRYDAELLERLVADLSVCDSLERTALFADAWASVVAGSFSLSSWAGLAGRLGKEEDPDVWAAALSPLSLLDVAVPDPERGAVQAFVRRVAGPALERLGWEPPPGASPRQATVRARLVGALGTLGADEGVRAEARRRFEAYLADPSSLPPDLVSPVVGTVVAAGGEQAWLAAFEQFKKAATPQEEVRHLYALAETPDEALISRTLELCLSEQVRTQDAPLLVQRIMLARAGRRLAWRWFEAHWEDLVARFPHNLLARMLEGTASLLDSDLVASVRDFVASHDVPIAALRLRQIVERMETNAELAERLRGEIASALG